MSTFWPLLKLQFIDLKMIVFYLKYRKTIFPDKFSEKNSNKRNLDFWTKSMENVNFLALFKTSSFST